MVNYYLYLRVILECMKNILPIIVVSLAFFAQCTNLNNTVTDADGNLYHTVKIGKQVWTVENLRTTKFNDGTPIPYVIDNSIWGTLATPAYCYYDNTTDENHIRKYGALYNWYAVDTKKLAPAGWHVPSALDWDLLKSYLITNGYNWEGTTTENWIAKSLAAKTDWVTFTVSGAIGNDLTKNNSSGFSALPGGYRGRASGNFLNFGMGGCWWNATVYDASYAYYHTLYYSRYDLGSLFALKSCGFSVKLLKD